MSIFAFLGGRHNKSEWEKALIGAGCKLPPKADQKTCEAMTAACIEEDCAVIARCSDTIMHTQSKEERSQSHLVLFSRYSRLSRLEPYACFRQKAAITKARKQVQEARKYK